MDAANRLKSVNNGSLGSYGYDGNGKRVKKTESGTTTYYVYSTYLDIAAMEVNSTGVQRAYVSGGWGQMVALLSPNGNFYWIHQDHLGSGRKMTDTNGNMIYRAEFDPYGKLLYEWSSSSQPNLNTKKFTGYERDAATGLDYAQARYYSADWGRFMTPDPMGLGAASKANPKSLNRYSYVNGNPTNFRDPGGTCFYYWYQMSETYGYWDSMFCYDDNWIEQPDMPPAGPVEPLVEPDITDLNTAFNNIHPNCKNFFANAGLVQRAEDMIDATKPGGKLHGMKIVDMRTQANEEPLIDNHLVGTYQQLWDRQSRDGRGSRNAPAKALNVTGIQNNKTIMLGEYYFDPGLIERLSGSWGGFNSKIKYQSNALVHEFWHIFFDKNEGDLLQLLRDKKANIPVDRSLTASQAIVKWQIEGCPVKN